MTPAAIDRLARSHAVRRLGLGADPRRHRHRVGVVMDDESKPCPVCHGKGYRRCDCWPGDCICAFGDEDCDHCDGYGRIWTDEEWDDIEFADQMSPARQREDE
jgi:hypothetical protein